MDITPYVDQLRSDLQAALAAQTDRDQAERLAATVQAPARLAMMGAVSQAAAEASSMLPSGRISVQLAGPELVVAFEPGPAAAPTGAPAEPSAEEDDGDQARLTLRLPAAIKARAEQAASAQGLSLNTWVVRALRDATLTDDVDVRVGPFGVHLRQPGRSSRGWV